MADNAHRPRPPPNRRRDKIQLSCDPCRNRKLKCDRQHPCGACSRRGLINSCKYATISSSTLDAQRSAAPRDSASLQSRISELEKLVVTLMKGHALPSSPGPKSPKLSSASSPVTISEPQRSERPHSEAEPSVDPGTLKLRESRTSYVQSAHWEAILTKIRGLKEDLVTDNKIPPGSQLFYGSNYHATRDEILVAIPPRPVVDRLMALHFDSFIITPYIIHSKRFLREYEAFWEDPSITSIAWIGLIYAMLSVSAQLQTFTLDFTEGQAESLKTEHLSMTDAFREKAVQCLILARYTRGGPYILESLIMILTGEFVLLRNIGTDGWLVMSMILHLATRMGYHRDPDHFPGISPFEGEMRRRIWTTILQLDIVVSLEMGLPRSATDTHIDTKPPLNLRDCDFGEDTIEMPAPRPETEWTPILPLITRRRLITALGLICDINTDVIPPSYDEVIRIDALLKDVYSHAIPPVLRWDTTRLPVTDDPGLMVQRISVETTYHKSRILLYRRFLMNYPVRQPQERDKESVRICLDSALKILSFQQMLHEESQPFGRLCHYKWKVTHISNQDVLLATSVLCLYLQDIDKFELSESVGHATKSLRADEVRQRLTTSRKIWLQMSNTTAEAGKVAKAISIVLGRTEVAAEDASELTSYGFATGIDAIPLNDPSTIFSNQCFPSGFYSPLAFFDNVLDNQGM